MKEIKAFLLNFEFIRFIRSKIKTWKSHVKVINDGFGHPCINATGGGNSIEIMARCNTSKLKIDFIGANSKVIIGKNVKFEKGCRMRLEGNNVLIRIGDDSSFNFNTAFLAHESNSMIDIGKDCLCSFNVIFRTSDSHGIYDQQGNRLNPPANVILEDHVWLSHDVEVMKGVTIHSGSVIGSSSIVTKDIPSKSVAVGIPAKVVKSDILWSHKKTSKYQG